MKGWLAGLLAAIIAGVVVYWLTAGIDKPNTVPPPLPNSNTIPGTTPDSKSAPQSTPTSKPPKPVIQYKLIWYNHFEQNRLYEVVRTDISRAEIRNEEFKQWCVPFDESQWLVREKRLIAADEHWKEDPTRLTQAPYNLPPMNERWFQIMDDERWFLYVVQPK